jgi:hypothetical protein
MYGGQERYIYGCGSGDMKEINHLENLGVDGSKY